MRIKDSQQFTITLTPEDAKGNPSVIDPTKTTFTMDNPALATLTPGADGLSCLVAGAGIGSGQIQYSVQDAAVTTDVVTGTLSLEVVGGDTAQVVANTSAPVDQPPVAPSAS